MSLYRMVCLIFCSSFFFKLPYFSIVDLDQSQILNLLLVETNYTHFHDHLEMKSYYCICIKINPYPNIKQMYKSSCHLSIKVKIMLT